MSFVTMDAVTFTRARVVVLTGLGVAATVAILVVGAGRPGAVTDGVVLSAGFGLLCGGWLIGLGLSHWRSGWNVARSLHTEIDFARTLLLAQDADQVRRLSRQRTLAGAGAPRQRRRGQLRYPDPRARQVADLADLADLVLSSIERLAAAEARAATDFVTGLATKQIVGDTLQRMVAQADRTREPMAVVMVDLDHFKEVNDRFGHPVGDRILGQVGAALRTAVRSSDFAGRSGGEEFAVLLPNTDLYGATQTAENIRSAIAEIHLDDVEVSVTASVGVAVYPVHSARPDELEQLADSALYGAKRAGRNQVWLAPPNEDLGVATPMSHRQSA